MTDSAQNLVTERITVRGLVQGVGFRPTVWRLARRYNIRGRVANSGEGVEILAFGKSEDLERFVAALKAEAAPLARVGQVIRGPITRPMGQLSGGALVDGEGFTIEESAATAIRTGVTADAATCDDCRAEVFDPSARRFRYPFTNCTRCGPRLTIIHNIPYD